ncbi:hypothetical protein [Streptomyces sp. NPDC006645]
MPTFNVILRQRVRLWVRPGPPLAPTPFGREITGILEELASSITRASR